MRIIKFRAFDKVKKVMCFVDALYSPLAGRFTRADLAGMEDERIYGSRSIDNQIELMRFTGLLDKNGVAEVYEGDIINPLGKIKGNIYESPQIYEKGIDLLIEEMGTNSWRDTESIAMGRGCRYA